MFTQKHLSNKKKNLDLVSRDFIQKDNHKGEKGLFAVGAKL